MLHDDSNTTLINSPTLYFQNQPLISYGRPKGDGEVRMVSSVDKRKQDRLLKQDKLCVFPEVFLFFKNESL